MRSMRDREGDQVHGRCVVSGQHTEGFRLSDCCIDRYPHGGARAWIDGGKGELPDLVLDLYEPEERREEILGLLYAAPTMKAEIERLTRWKCEAMEVNLGWSKVATALGLDIPDPADLGKSQAEVALREVGHLLDQAPSFSPDEYRCTINGARWCPEAELEDLKEQRDELLEALLPFCDPVYTNTGGNDEIGFSGTLVYSDRVEGLVDAARAAIAKATAAKEVK